MTLTPIITDEHLLPFTHTRSSILRFSPAAKRALYRLFLLFVLIAALPLIVQPARGRCRGRTRTKRTETGNDGGGGDANATHASSTASTSRAIRKRAYTARRSILASFHRMSNFDWRSNIAFKVTKPMRVSIALSLVLGVVLGAGVGVLSGLEPAVVIGVSASMALGCVFVMSFAIVHGVPVLRATAFAIFVSVCLPLGFGVGFGFGILAAVFMGIEHPDDVRDKTSHFVTHFSDFTRVVLAFTLEIV